MFSLLSYLVMVMSRFTQQKYDKQFQGCRRNRALSYVLVVTAVFELVYRKSSNWPPCKNPPWKSLSNKSPC